MFRVRCIGAERRIGCCKPRYISDVAKGYCAHIRKSLGDSVECLYLDIGDEAVPEAIVRLRNARKLDLPVVTVEGEVASQGWWVPVERVVQQVREAINKLQGQQ